MFQTTSREVFLEIRAEHFMFHCAIFGKQQSTSKLKQRQLSDGFGSTPSWSGKHKRTQGLKCREISFKVIPPKIKIYTCFHVWTIQIGN